MNTIVIGIILVVALIAVVLIIMGNRRTATLRTRFGPEYDATIKTMRDRDRAESELVKRTERVEQLKLRPLAPADRSRFEQSWQADQARFVDDPRGAVREADHLVIELMQARGYPVADFDQRAADVSVDHPHVVERYRAAHEIAGRDVRNEADTEDLRNAIVHYRALFQELLVADTASTDSAAASDTPSPAVSKSGS